jgi:hypothetical protein
MIAVTNDMTSPSIAPGRDHADDTQEVGDREGGFVLAWMALMIVVMLSLAGLALDVAHWYVVASKAQKAADAAALAGAVYLPEGTTNGIAAAYDIASDNGFADSGRNDVVVQVGARPEQLEVAVTTTVDNFFGQLMGFRTQRITRTAIAEFERPVPMGSPSNVFGNAPQVSCAADGCVGNSYSVSSPDFWINVSGPNTFKANGDSRQSWVCSVTTPATDRCTGTNAPPGGDYDAGGYYYVARVTGTGGGRPLRIDAFDAPYVHVGLLCDSNDTNLTGAAALPNAVVPGASVRYAFGNASAFCTGDAATETGGTPMITTIIVRAPDDSPWDPTNNPVVCTRQFNGWRNGDLGVLLDPRSPSRSDELIEAFRRWAAICTINNPEIGDYVIQVRGNAPWGQPLVADSTSNRKGGNRMSLRASFVGGSSATNDSVSLFAQAAMGIYANADEADINFHLARVPTGSAGRFLHLRFFDVGDAACCGTLQILPPTDARDTITGSLIPSFSGCTYSQPPSGGMVPTPGSNCRITSVSTTNYQGQFIDMVIPIPATYSCTDASAGGCWVRIRFQFSDGVHDATTWSAWMEGDPVRLIE